MVVAPECFLRWPGHQRTVPGVRQVVVAVGCVVLVGLREVVEQALAQCDDYPGVNTRRFTCASIVKLTK